MTDTNMRADIIDTLNQLMDEKQLSKITITDIANRCGVSRQTIYYHFSNLGELVDAAFEWELTQFLEEIEKCTSAREIVTAMILLARYKSRLVHNFAADKHKAKIDARTHDIITRILEEISDTALSERPKSEYEKTISFYSYALAGILTDIGREDNDIDKEAEQLLQIMCNGFKIKDGLLTKS